MADNISNKITFSAKLSLREKILTEIAGEDRCIDFNTLIPKPLSIYVGDIGRDESGDFKKNTWHEWALTNWHTKWNAYGGLISQKGNVVNIYFETAWSIPYPIIITFANKYKVDFVYKYFNENGSFWGIEKWENTQRVERKRNHEDMKKELCSELLSYEP